MDERSERTASGTLGATGSVVLTCPGANSVLVHVGAGLTGTLVPEYLTADGVTWEAGAFITPLTGSQQSSLVNPAAGTYLVGPGGSAKQVRVRCSAYTSGSTVIDIEATSGLPYFTPATTGSATSTMADAESNSTVGRVGARNEGYNGSTWDLFRASKAGVSSNVLSAWTGVQMMQPYGQYASTKPVMTDGQGAPLMVGPDGILLVKEANLFAGEDPAHGLQWSGPCPVADNTNALTTVDSAALELSHVLKASSGRLYGIDGHHEAVTRTVTISCASTTNSNTIICAPGSNGVFTITITGTWTGTIQFEMFDGQNWVSFNMTGTSSANNATANGAWTSSTPGALMAPGMQFRARSSNGAGTGTATIVVGGPILLWLQIFNTASVPADSTVPAMTIPLGPYESLAAKLPAYIGLFGRYFSTGISWSLSETPATKTIPASGNGQGWFSGAVK